MKKFRLLEKLSLLLVLLGYFMPIIKDETIGVVNIFELIGYAGTFYVTIGVCWFVSIVALIILIVLSIYDSIKSYILPSSTYLVFPFLSLIFFLIGTGFAIFINALSIGGYFIIFGWLLTFIFVALSRAPKKCPYCAELVKIDAKLCPHCGKEFVEQEKKQHNKQHNKQHSKKNYAVIGYIVGIVIVYILVTFLWYDRNFFTRVLISLFVVYAVRFVLKEKGNTFNKLKEIFTSLRLKLSEVFDLLNNAKTNANDTNENKEKLETENANAKNETVEIIKTDNTVKTDETSKTDEVVEKD